MPERQHIAQPCFLCLGDAYARMNTVTIEQKHCSVELPRTAKLFAGQEHRDLKRQCLCHGLSSQQNLLNNVSLLVLSSAPGEQPS